MKHYFKRRDFLKKTFLGSSFLGISIPAFSSQNSKFRESDLQAKEKQVRSAQSVIGLRVDPINQVRIAFIGIGSRGLGHLKLAGALLPDKATITAVCDIREERATLAKSYLKDEHNINVASYSGQPESWKEMVKRDDIDLVIIATPWEDHAAMAAYAMQQGKHVAVEVPLALTIDECWDLVRTAEETQRNCMMLENVCYGDEELWILQMALQGVFGTLTYGEAAYIHDLRDGLYNSHRYNHWRIKHNIARDGNLYPTHGLGPVAQYMGINRGDSFERLVSMSSLEASLSEGSLQLDPDHEFYGLEDVQHGDMNNSLIKTAKGRTILVQHDVVTPRPYSRINALAGTKAYHEGYPSRLAVRGKGHDWLSDADYQEYREKYKHPIWEKLKVEIEKYGGHGGMDFVQMYRLIHCLNQGWPLDMDVYDGVAWSAVTPLSAMSIELGNVPVKFPDFTRGDWKKERKLGIMQYL